MNRRSLGIIAVVLIVLMAIVATAGLDNLPRHLRDSVAAAATHLASDRSTLDQNRQFVDDAVRKDPALFGNKAEEWRTRIEQDRTRLESTAASLAALQQLAKSNRRTDADKVESELASFDAARQGPVQDSTAIRAETEKWLKWKQELPGRLSSMQASYDQLKSFDLQAAAAPVAKAMVDWPEKKADLQARFDALKASQAEGEKLWNSTAPLREAAGAGRVQDFDYAAFFGAGERLDALARDVKQNTESLNALAAQLYTSWDKVLVDAGDDHGSYREKFRLVRTKYPDATLANGQVTSEEKWEPVSRAQYRDAERTVGMTVERKPAGKYDSEAERVAQPPAYAYIAPPGQANQYGSWSGGVWHWLPQYLLLSQLLHMSRPAITTGDFDAYQAARRRGEIFYGQNNEYRPPSWSAPRGGSGWSWGKGSASSTPGQSSSGGWYKERPKSWGSSGFGGSKYQSRGGFSGSRYQSGGGFRSFGGSAARGAMRSFGRGGRR